MVQIIFGYNENCNFSSGFKTVKLQMGGDEFVWGLEKF